MGFVLINDICNYEEYSIIDYIDNLNRTKEQAIAKMIFMFERVSEESRKHIKEMKYNREDINTIFKEALKDY